MDPGQTAPGSILFATGTFKVTGRIKTKQTTIVVFGILRVNYGVLHLQRAKFIRIVNCGGIPVPVI